MKKILKIIIVFGSIYLLLFAYGFRSDNSSLDQNLIVKSKGKPIENITGSCMEPYCGKPEELLTKELVSKFVDFENAEVEVATLASKLDFRAAFSSGKSDTEAKKEEEPIQSEHEKEIAMVFCEWKIERQRHKISLGSINKITLYKSKTPVDRFYDKYHTRTPEEQAALKKLYDSLVVNNPKVKKKTDRSTAELLSESTGFDFQYINIDDIGDAAVWEYKINDLKVLVGDYQFTVNVDLNKGNDYDLEKAKLIAKAIIEKACD